MTVPQPVDDKQPDADQARFMARVKLLMALSGFATMLGIAVVIGIVGYRVFRSGGSAAPSETTVLLPKGGKILQTAVAGDRIVVTVDIGGGALEIRTFDAQNLRPAGRLRFASEP